MPNTHFKSVDEYMAAQPRAAQVVQNRVRRAIRRAVPRAEEVISYNIPAYKLRGRTVIYFAGWKQHFSLYPSTRQLVAAFEQQLAPYEVNGKGTIRFPLSGKVPVSLIEGIARFRAKEVAGGERSTPARERGRPVRATGRNRGAFDRDCAR